MSFFAVLTKIIPGGASSLSDSISILSMEIEKDTNFTEKEITYIAASWTQSEEELAELLSTTAKSDCRDILKEWLKQQVGDKRGKLADKFDDNEYPNMASLIYDMSVS